MSRDDEQEHGHERAGGVAHGASRLIFDAVEETTRSVEGLHANIAAAPLPLGPGTDGRTRGIARLVYESIRLTTRAAGLCTNGALALLGRTSLGRLALPQPQWDAALSALNGVLGDHLFEQRNPLAIPMQWRRGGQAIRPGDPALGTKWLLLVHGLCMNDRQWLRAGHDHGASLARDLGYTPIYLFYDTGRHVSENGRELAQCLETLVAASAQPVEELTILAHSMGGLVARSACQIAAEQQRSWLKTLRRIVFLGTPHHGAPLERVGAWVHQLAERSPYVAPLARVARLRSAGISDLRHGSVHDADWRDADRFARSGDQRQPVALPDGVSCHTIAGTLATRGGRHAPRFVGDGLVPLESALGQHADPTRTLAFPETHRWIGTGVGHLDLLDRPEVYDVIRGWLTD